MHLRVMLVESDPEDLLFLEDVLIEIEDGRQWNQWLEVESQGASSCSEAAAILRREPIDIILLNPNLTDSQGAAAFRQLHEVAPRVPIILLVETADRDLAVQLMREGAQDFAVKKHIDCALLAHAVRNAIERHRLLEAVRSTTMTDPLTGLLHRGAFYSLAERDRKLAQALDRRLLLIVAEPRDLSGLTAASGDHARDLAMVDAGDVLRGLGGYTGLVGRVEDTRLALALLETDAEAAENMRERIQAVAATRRIATGAAVFEPEQAVTLEILLERAALDLTAAPLTANAAYVRR